MRKLILTASAAFCAAGCLNPAALTQSARKIEGKVTPATRAFANGSRRVVQYAGQAADDAALAARVQAALMLMKGVRQGGIHVYAEEGVVRLTGHVSSAVEKRIAGEAARGTVGVTSVVNRLTVIKRA